jgi:hypothetical protein
MILIRYMTRLRIPSSISSPNHPEAAMDYITGIIYQTVRTGQKVSQGGIAQELV